MLGEERLLSGPRRASRAIRIGVDFEWRDRKMKLFDTAGLRRRARVIDKLEKLAGADALRAVRFSEVVVLLVNSTIPFEKQDLTIADLAAREGRAVVIGARQMGFDRGSRQDADKIARRSRAPARRSCGAARLFRSPARPAQGLDELMRAVIAVHEIWNKRISTARLNRWLLSTIERDAAAGGLRAGASRSAI